MTFANIRIPEDFIPDPNFKPFLEKMALDCPQFMFVRKPSDTTANSSLRCVMSKVAAPEGKRFTAFVDVQFAETGEHLGRIGAMRKYRSRGPDDCVFFVDSWRITNSRGNSNQSTTTKLTGAVRTAKRMLVPRKYEELFHMEAEEMGRSMNSALHVLIAPIGSGRLMPTNGLSLMQSYLYYHMNGVEVPANIASALQSAIKTDKFQKAFEEFNLGVHMTSHRSANRLRFVVEHAGLFVVVFNDTDGVEAYAFEHLPEWMQNHVSVLQLMQDREIVRDVGYRHEAGRYIVVAPV